MIGTNDDAVASFKIAPSYEPKSHQFTVSGPMIFTPVPWSAGPRYVLIQSTSWGAVKWLKFVPSGSFCDEIAYKGIPIAVTCLANVASAAAHCGANAKFMLS